MVGWGFFRKKTITELPVRKLQRKKMPQKGVLLPYNQLVIPRILKPAKLNYGKR